MKYIVFLVPARHRLRLRRGGRVFVYPVAPEDGTGVTLWLSYYPYFKKSIGALKIKTRNQIG